MQSFGGEDGDQSRNIELARSSLLSSRQYSTPTLELEQSPVAGENGGRGGGTDNRQRQVTAHQPEASMADSARSTDAGFWSAEIRRPKAGERVQVYETVSWCVLKYFHLWAMNGSKFFVVRVVSAVRVIFNT